VLTADDNKQPSDTSRAIGSARRQHGRSGSRSKRSGRKGRHAKPPYSRFIQKIVGDPGAGHSWVVDHRFDIANHVVGAPAEVARSPDSLRRYVSQMADRKLSWDRPLWELHVIEPATVSPAQQSSDCNGVDDDVTTLALLRLHPVVSDGVKLVRLICCRLADDDEFFASASGWRTTARCHYGRLAYSFNVVRALFVGKSLAF
jgi:hypothetical protein